MQVTIKPSLVKGKISAPPSKSMAHRLLISAAMSEGESIIQGISQSADVCATLDCLRALGVRCDLKGDTVRVVGVDPRKNAPISPLLCRESGSTLRFLLPIALLSGQEAVLRGAPSLMRRPMSIYQTLCEQKGMAFLQAQDEIRVRGPLQAGEYRVLGNVSSQFISGLLFALPLTDGDSRICIEPPVESRSYIDMTLSALHIFGVRAEWQDDGTLFIPGNQKYCARAATVEGDYSNAAFLDAFNHLGGSVRVEGLREDSLQGDRVYRQYFDRLETDMPTLDIGDCPDLGPILFALAAAQNGATFTGTRRLRIKESDRVAAMAEELQKLGARLVIEEDRVTVLPSRLHPPTVPLSGHNDHRVVMSCAVLLSCFGGSIVGAEAVSKSFPNFFDCVRTLGVEVAEYD